MAGRRYVGHGMGGRADGRDPGRDWLGEAAAAESPEAAAKSCRM